MSPDLRANYLGMELASPIVASSSPVTGKVESLLELQAAGAGAVVLPSLFQEEVEAEELALADLMDIGEGFAEFDSSPVLTELDDAGPERHLKLMRAAREALDIPVLGSVNGVRPGDWAEYSRMLADAGAQGLELNLFSVNADPGESSAQVEDRYLRIIEQVRAAVTVPLAIKLSQHITGLSYFAKRVEQAGADGLVLFNRFYGAEVDLDSLSLESKLNLSSPAELRFPLRWIGILRAQCELYLAATSGVHSGADVLKALLVGADVACTASAVLHGGPAAITAMIAEITDWLQANEYDSLAQLTGSMSAENIANPGEFERAQYMKVISSYR